MQYLTLDTCVWLELLKTGLHSENNVFEEICFWMEGKHLVHITTENLIREWERNKVKKSQEIFTSIKAAQKQLISPLRGTPEFASTYEPEKLQEIINQRIERVDAILKTHSEIARENQEIFSEAARRNLDCLAPNHSEDSFRDTVNILTLVHYVGEKKYSKCSFSTINYSDFSAEKSSRHTLHPQLTEVFERANLEYIYCDEGDSFGGRLLNERLRPNLPNFLDSLVKKKKDQEEQKLKEKIFTAQPVSSPDEDFIENIKYIDMILSKRKPTVLEESLLTMILNRHESYRQYFLRNVGRNGMV